MNCGLVSSNDDEIAEDSCEALKYCQKDGEKKKTTIDNKNQSVGSNPSSCLAFQADHPQPPDNASNGGSTS